MWVDVKEFENLFDRLGKKIHKLFASLGSVRIVKTCDLCHNFLIYGPPSRQITFIYLSVDLISIGDALSVVNLGRRI